MVTMGMTVGTVSTALTTLPRLRATDPVRPVIAARMVVKFKLMRAVSTAASLARTVASKTARLSSRLRAFAPAQYLGLPARSGAQLPTGSAEVEPGRAPDWPRSVAAAREPRGHRD